MAAIHSRACCHGRFVIFQMAKVGAPRPVRESSQRLDHAHFDDRIVVVNDAVLGLEPCPHTGNPWKLRGRLFDPHSIINRSKLLRDFSDGSCVALVVKKALPTQSAL
jgi:hypothetical protein